MLKFATMNVGLDGQALIGDIPTGFGIYTQLLHRALLELQQDSHLTLVLFKPKAEKAFRRVSQRVYWERVKLPRLISMRMKEKALELFHSPCLGAPHPLKIPLIVTIHDLILLEKPPRGILARYYFTKVVPAGWRRASLIICHTEYVRSQVVEVLGIKQGKIDVIPLYSRFYGHLAEAVPKSPPFTILFVGTLEERKNLRLLLRAVSLLPDRLKRDVKLKIVGILPADVKSLQSLVHNLGLAQNVSFMGYQPADQLRLAYENCHLVVSPSKDEGFGLVPLEAMSLNRAVLISDIPAHREVYGSPLSPSGERLKYPAFFDPNSAEDLALLIQRCIEDADFYSELRRMARLIASAYTPQSFRKSILTSYQKCLSISKRQAVR